MRARRACVCGGLRGQVPGPGPGTPPDTPVGRRRGQPRPAPRGRGHAGGHRQRSGAQGSADHRGPFDRRPGGSRPHGQARRPCPEGTHEYFLMQRRGPRDELRAHQQTQAAEERAPLQEPGGLAPAVLLLRKVLPGPRRDRRRRWCWGWCWGWRGKCSGGFGWRWWPRCPRRSCRSCRSCWARWPGQGTGRREATCGPSCGPSRTGRERPWSRGAWSRGIGRKFRCHFSRRNPTHSGDDDPVWHRFPQCISRRVRRQG